MNKGGAAMGPSSLFAPFRVRSFRFQYPADMLTSWGSEMENLILGWYVLVETGSVFLLTVFGSLQYFGTLVAPVLGMAGDRMGHRNVLCAMRIGYAALASILMALAFTGSLRPLFVLIVAGVAGLVRPSDLAMRSAIVAETMPVDCFISAMGASRTTSDSARTVGALAGAGLFAALGMGPAYVFITCFYLVGFLLTLGIGSVPTREGMVVSVRPSLWRDLREGLAYLWDTPSSLAGLWLAFLVNLTAYPLTSGLLPYMAMDIYHVDQTGLGYLIASFASGALLGSIAISMAGRAIRPARMMIVFAVAWYAMLLVFVHTGSLATGVSALVLAGLAQSLSLVPMSALLLHGAGAFRGRVMGMRMLAIYGLPIGLMAAGALIDWIGFRTTASLYCCVGLLFTLLIALHWRTALWPLQAQANTR
jgi:predicted MFS family arabinose efflux permease